MGPNYDTLTALSNLITPQFTLIYFFNRSMPNEEKTLQNKPIGIIKVYHV